MLLRGDEHCLVPLIPMVKRFMCRNVLLELTAYRPHPLLPPRRCGMGVYHTGVEVFGVEYAFGGHDFDASGVFATNPRSPPGNVKFRESIVAGPTQMTPAAVQQVVQQLGQEYRGNCYHLLQKNCNHFASQLCGQLTGRPAPGWINRLAGLAVALHCLLPTTWVPPLETPSVDPTSPLHETRPSGRPSKYKVRHEERHVLINAPTSDRPFIADSGNAAAARSPMPEGMSKSGGG